MTTSRKNYDLIDLLKFVGSILIFAMHMSAFADFGEGVNTYCLKLLARFGFPFFFVTSSFLLFSKAEGKNITSKQLGHYVKRIACLYATYFILNIIWLLYSRIGLSNLLSLKAWLTFLKNALFASTFTGSWYLVSCIFSSIVVYWLSRKLSTRNLLLVTAPVYLFCILTSAYAGLLPDAFLNGVAHYFAAPQNSIICGVFFFALGKYIAEKQKTTDSSIHSRLYGILSLLFLALYYVEIILLDHFGILGGTDAAIMLIPLSYTLTMACVNSTRSVKGASLMRRASTIIYCSQATVMLLASIITIKILGIHHTFVTFLIAAVGMMMFVAFAIWLQKKAKMKWAKYLT